VLVPARVVGLGALPVLQVLAVVGEVRLDAAIAREAKDSRRAPAGLRRTEVGVCAFDGGGDLADEERVELAVGRVRVEQPEEREGVGGGLEAGAAVLSVGKFA